MARLVLDTNAVIYIVGDSLEEPPPDGPYAISILTEIEVLGYQLLDRDTETKIRRLLDSLEIVPLAEEIKELAIVLRQGHRLKTPDAIIAATAIALNSPLVSNDSDLDRVPDLKRVPLALKAQ